MLTGEFKVRTHRVSDAAWSCSANETHPPSRLVHVPPRIIDEMHPERDGRAHLHRPCPDDMGDDRTRAHEHAHRVERSSLRHVRAPSGRGRQLYARPVERGAVRGDAHGPSGSRATSVRCLQLDALSPRDGFDGAAVDLRRESSAGAQSAAGGRRGWRRLATHADGFAASLKAWRARRTNDGAGSSGGRTAAS